MGLLQNLTGWHAVIIFAIVLLIFGTAKLPALARSIGQSMRIIKTELHDTTDAPTTVSTTTPTAPSTSTRSSTQDRAA